MDEKDSYEDLSNYTSKLDRSRSRSTDFYADYDYEQTLVFILFYFILDTSCKTLMGMDS
jgi:hypothetical protein